MTSVFLTGASGYIGGQTLKDLSSSRPDLEIAALVRDSAVADKISKLYPKVRVVVGGLDDAAIVESEAEKADIILNMASTAHIPGAQAIKKGLSKRSTTSYWLQISGASALAATDLASPDYDVGLPSDKVWDDLDGLDELRAHLRANPQRASDNFVLDVAQEMPSVKTALVFPPIIYGKGQGPWNQRSIQLQALARVALERGHAVRTGRGLNRWGSIHVYDVASVFIGLVDEALKGNQDEAIWGANGLYLASSDEHSFADISDGISRAAREQGVIESDEVEELSKTASDQVLPSGSIYFGSNARGNARRATALFGWKPSSHTLEKEIPRVVAEEAASRGQ